MLPGSVLLQEIYFFFKSILQPHRQRTSIAEAAELPRRARPGVVKQGGRLPGCLPACPHGRLLTPVSLLLDGQPHTDPRHQASAPASFKPGTVSPGPAPLPSWATGPGKATLALPGVQAGSSRDLKERTEGKLPLQRGLGVLRLSHKCIFLVSPLPGFTPSTYG